MPSNGERLGFMTMFRLLRKAVKYSNRRGLEGTTRGFLEEGKELLKHFQKTKL